MCVCIYTYIHIYVRIHSRTHIDRDTTIGKMIDSYLKSATDIEDHCIHLLFSANRWEAKNEMMEALNNGETIIVDRYGYSGNVLCVVW
jgi:dTMP kinase